MSEIDNSPAPEQEPMSDREICSRIDQWRHRAINDDEDELSNRRTDALNYYRMERYGDEQDGHSTAITGEVLETIEWAIPSIVRTFLTGLPVKFRALNQADVEQADHETDVVTWFIRSNPECFAELTQWFKDALMYPNGYLKVWWDKRTEYEFEEYSGLLEEQVMGLQLDPSVQVVAAEQEQGPIPTFSIVLRTDKRISKLCFAATPSEEVLVSDNATSLELDEADYVVHEPTDVTRSDLLAMGYDYDLVMSLQEKNDDLDSGERANRRRTVDENSGLYNSPDEEMMQRVEYVEAYGRIDVDGDGYAEYRKICKVDTDVLSIEYATCQPFCTLTSLVQSHRHIGIGLAEVAMPIQRQNSALTRQALDNLYRTNNPRAILGRSINRDEWDNYEPHGGVSGNPGDYAPEVVPVAVQHVLPWLQHQDDELAARTGISKHAMGLDADTLASSTMGAYLEAAGASSQRLEMVIRTFAEIGMAQFVRKVHELVRRHQNAPLEAEISGEWVMSDPRAWKKRTDVVPMVGIGTGSHRERAASANTILELQERVQPYGLTTPAHAYNTLRELVQALGRHDVGAYFVDPKSEQGQMLAQNMEAQKQMAAEMAKQQVDQVLEIELAKVRQRAEEAIAKLQLDLAKHQDKVDYDYTKLELEQDVDVPGEGLNS